MSARKTPKEKSIAIEWRIKSQADFLPKTDLAWTNFATLRAGRTRRTYDSAKCSASMIVKALTAHDLTAEFRIKE
jgi:hypothetical protein